MWYDSTYNTINGRKDYLDCSVRETLGNILWQRAVTALSAGDQVPDTTIDEMLGKPSTLTMADWKAYSLRKQFLRDYLTRIALSPSLVQQYVNQYGNKSS